MDDIYLKLPDNKAYIELLWSSNESLDPNATGTIGIYVYDENGNEHDTIEGGELDIYNDDPLQSHISDIFDFIEIPADTNYEIIDEYEFNNIIYGD